MSFIHKLRNIQKNIISRKNSIFNCPVDKQKRILLSLPNPKDDIDRSYNQYLCQKKIDGIFYYFLMNLISIPLLLINKKNKKSDLSKDTVKSVFISEGIPSNVIPNVLKDEFGLIKNVESEYTDYNDYAKELYKLISKRHFFSFYFKLKCLYQIKMLCTIRDKYDLKAIIVNREYSFASSVGTMYCEHYGIEYINVMHGEKLFYIRDSFFRFSRCYVWSDYYIDLFCSLRAENNSFYTFVPDSLRFSDEYKSVKKDIDFTYYLGYEDKNLLIRIYCLLLELNKKGYSVRIRCHPRYSDMKLIHEIFREHVDIEEFSSVNIETSVMRSRNVISRYSTILNQAYHNGVNIVIDDLSDPDNFKKLHDLKYIMLDVEHTNLSDLINL